jgi:hypothetical protein
MCCACGGGDKGGDGDDGTDGDGDGENEEDKTPMEQCDTNGDGMLSLEEFKPCYDQGCNEGCPDVTNTTNTACVCKMYEAQEVFYYYEMMETMDDMISE